MTDRRRQLVIGAGLALTLAGCASEEKIAPPPQAAPPTVIYRQAPPPSSEGSPNFGEVVDEAKRRKKVLEELRGLTGGSEP